MLKIVIISVVLVFLLLFAVCIVAGENLAPCQTNSINKCNEFDTSCMDPCKDAIIVDKYTDTQFDGHGDGYCTDPFDYVNNSSSEYFLKLKFFDGHISVKSVSKAKYELYSIGDIVEHLKL